jgi:hypothetical protein
VVCDFKPLRIRCAGNKGKFGANRVPVSFQAKGKAVDWSAVLQNFARDRFGCDEELGARRRHVFQHQSWH